jgi:hypothetical protein
LSAQGSPDKNTVEENEYVEEDEGISVASNDDIMRVDTADDEYDAKDSDFSMTHIPSLSPPADCAQYIALLPSP